MNQSSQFLVFARAMVLAVCRRALRLLASVSLVGAILVGLPPALATTGPQVRVLMTTQVVSDSVSNSNPKTLPGSIIEFQARVTYDGQEALTGDSLAIINAVPPALSLMVADASPGNASPFLFVDGERSSDLTCNFLSLDDSGDCIEFSANGGTSFDYRPTPDFVGIDPAITHLRFRLRGAMSPAAAEPSYFILKYRMKVD